MCEGGRELMEFCDTLITAVSLPSLLKLLQLLLGPPC